jgi:uncharacterized membrane protein HdeD (DUF308 family)
MKTIRYLAPFLLLLSGILHAIPIFTTPSDPNALPMLVFGIIYFTIGVLLLLNLWFAPYLAVFPLIGLGIGFFVVGIKNWTAMLTFLFTIDVVVIICCIRLILNRKPALAAA